MKRLSIITITLAAFSAIGSLTSCQDEELGYTKAEIVQSTYEKNFVNTYGEVAPGHMWGFDTSAITRAYTATEKRQYKLIKMKSSDEVKAFTGLDGESYEMQLVETDGSWDMNYDDKLWVTNHYKGPVGIDEKNYVNQYLIEHENEGSLECPLDSYVIYNLGYLNQGANVGHMDELHFDQVHFQQYNGGSGCDYFVTNSRIYNPWYNDTDRTSQKTENHYRFYTIPEHTTEGGYHFPGGVYLCFDYGGKQQNLFDNIFNDWVLKIAPGPIEMQKIKRVMCEDLGNTHDWDFNDVVYDYEQITPNVAKISIQAVCGTLPIYFTTDGKSLTLGKSINGGNQIPQGNDNLLIGEAAELHLVCGGTTTDVQITYGTSAKRVVYVKCSDIMNLGILRQDNSGMPWYKNPQEQEGKVPFLIACPVSTTPSPEDINIATTYSKWIQYVSNPSVEWWN